MCKMFKTSSGLQRENLKDDYEDKKKNNNKEIVQETERCRQGKGSGRSDICMCSFWSAGSVGVPRAHILSLMYYMRKLSTCKLHSFWHRHEEGPLLPCGMKSVGWRGANKISSCLYQFIESLPVAVRNLAFYSANHGGQNRNLILPVMYLKALHNFPCIQSITPFYGEGSYTEWGG